MRVTRLVLSLVLSGFVLFPCAAQHPAASDAQAAALLQRAFAALNGGAKPVADVTLSGTARSIAGSDDDTGTAVFKAVTSGAGRMDLSLSSGQRSEVCNLSGTTPVGSWSGPDGISHAIVFHNLLTEPVWFFPAFAIARKLSSTGFVATYVGRETRNGQAVEHVSVSQAPPTQLTSGAPLFKHLTQVDFFLDSTSLLPVAISFDAHSDSDALVDIPVEVRFSDYRAVNGSQVPYHLQKYLNNSLSLDFQVESVALNTGLSTSTFNVH